MDREESLLRLYLDSVEKEDWKIYLSTGIFFGVTTNPKLIQKAGIEFNIKRMAKLAQDAFGLGAKEIHIQVWGKETERMLEIGRELSAIDPRVMVKVPISRTGVLCARQLIAEGSNVTLTAVHSAQQALIAIALGARYAAPYLGRMVDGGLDGLSEVTTMSRIVNETNSSLRLLVASIRQVDDLVTLAERGLNDFTLRPALVDELLENELTSLAVESFETAVVESKG